MLYFREVAFDMEKNIEELIKTRNAISLQQREMFLDSIERINMRNRELLTNDFGATLAQNISRDLAGEVVRRYFDLGDFYITADQLADRFLHFSYDNDPDFLMSNEETRKSVYNYTDSMNSGSRQKILSDCQQFQSQLFTTNRAEDRFDINGKKNYRNSQIEHIYEKDGKFFGTIRDELSGREFETTTKPQNKHDWYSRELQADHILPREATTYNARYIKSSDEILNKYREFYNSDANMQMMLASANGSKGDARVCKVNGTIKYMNPKSKDYDPATDITANATSDQLVEAAVHQWETAGASASENMKKGGYLDENGKVKKEVKENYKKQVEEMLAARSRTLGDLKDLNYQNITSDAAKAAKKSVGKIIMGQFIYYVMPPVIFEAQQIIRKKGMSLEKFLKELKKSSKRVIAYVKDKMSDILINIVGNTVHKFVKVFFDIIIEMVRTTIKRMLKIVKNLVLSLVNCCKTIMNPETSAAQKADSITKIMFTTINTIVLEIIFEYLEKQFSLPDIIMEPLQLIVTIISTNAIMLVLDKVDLFNVRYGLLSANIEKIFNEENARYVEESKKLLAEGYQASSHDLKLITANITEIMESMKLLDMQKDDVLESLENVNHLFSMGIDFEEEWYYFSGQEVAIEA